jgi:hypothetical protein
MTRKGGTHFCDKVMLKLLIWRMFLSIRRFRLIGTCYKLWGLAKANGFFIFQMIACNLLRIPKLLANAA